MAQTETKFRAWDDGAMVYSHNNSENTEYFQLSWFFGKIREDAITMQFTGLHDKNGKEIYESDICSRNRHPEKYEIVFYKSGWAMKNETKEAIWHQHFCNGSNSKELEVIGNIYENPKILN